MKQMMIKRKFSQTPYVNNQQGVVLLEALIAILIFSFGILALAGLQGAMIKNTTDANYRSEASFIAQRQLGIMWGNPNNLSTYVGTTAIPTLPSGAMTVTTPASERVEVTITWQQPGEPTHNYQANAYILKGCPTCI
jgi:type IV pilus assembly protein PilV